MRKLIIILFVLISYNKCELLSQDGWFWLNPLPDGNRIISISNIINSTFYIYSENNTIIKTTNNGLNFSILHDISIGSQLFFINENTGFSNSSGGIYKTTNGGTNWRFIPGPVDSIYSCIYSPQVTLYSTKGNKAYVSSDLGESWNLKLTSMYSSPLNFITFADQFNGYSGGMKPFAGNYTLLYKTTNQGFSWDTLHTNLTQPIRLAYFVNNVTGFLVTYLENSIYRTTNGGYNWIFNQALNEPYFSGNFINTSTGYVKNLSGNLIYYTTNQGTNWLTKNFGIPINIFNIDNILGIKENFVFKTTNVGSTWSNVSQSFRDSLLSISFINVNTGFVGSYAKIYKTTNSGLNWSVVFNGSVRTQGIQKIYFKNQQTGYAGHGMGIILITTNSGSNWINSNTAIYYQDIFTGMQYTSNDTGYISMYLGNTYKTSNRGVNWTTGFHGMEVYLIPNIAFINNTTGFTAGYTYGQITNKYKVFHTYDGGLTTTNYNLDSLNSLDDLCSSPSNNWYITGKLKSNPLKGVVYRSTNLGNNWSYTVIPQYANNICFPDANTGYASSYNNVIYKTTNDGINWFPTVNIMSNELSDMCFLNSNTGFGTGVFSQIIKTTTGGGSLIGVEPINYTVPKDFVLKQNYPNPFNPVTKINFELPKAMDIELKVFDITGKVVKELINSFLVPGTYSVDFDGSSLSSGVYFYVISSNDFYEAKKMVLVK